MDKDYRKEMFEELLNTRISGKFCLHCRYRKSLSLNGGTTRKKVCCTMQPSRHSNSGFRAIRAHDDACGLYEQRL